MADKYVPRLKEQYFATVRDELQKQFGYKNVNQIPKKPQEQSDVMAKQPALSRHATPHCP